MDNIKVERSMSIFKRDDMIQSGRVPLSKVEQKAILYAISKIKPSDTHLTGYIFSIGDFYKIIGWEKESFSEFKTMLKTLSDKSWWLKDKQTGTESLVRWFSAVRVREGKNGLVEIKFHEDMMPFLLNLMEQDEFYTSYSLKYILPMNSKHSPRLYEILKSYQKNNTRWFFDIEQLKTMMCCENYKRWPDFRRYALDPAVEEINKFTDLRIIYDVKKDGRKYSRVIFYMDEKTAREKRDAEDEVEIALSGQLDILSQIEEARSGSQIEFVKERAEAHRKEREEAEAQARNLNELKQFYGKK